VTQIGQSYDLVIFRRKYLENGSSYRLVTNYPLIGNGVLGSNDDVIDDVT